MPGLPLARREQLQTSVELSPPYCMRFELDADQGGPERRSWIKLRCLVGILQALGREFERSTDGCLSSRRDPTANPQELVSIRYLGQRYASPPDPAGQGRLPLSRLSALCQLTVSEVPGEPLPAITIAK